MGNSEVGHLNLGAGFIVYQWITRIDRAIADGTFAKNEALTTAMDRVKEQGTTLHLIGLVSNGGVHSHIRHLDALVDVAKQRGVTRLVVQVITDGRDTSPTSGAGFVQHVERTLADAGIGRIATVSGRYYAMDRDHRWDRTKRAFDAIVHADGPTATSAIGAVRKSYDHNVTDEFIVPTVITDENGHTEGVQGGDAIIFFNFRSDRARQLTEALSQPDFDAFDRGTMPQDISVTTMTTYEKGLPVAVAFEPHDVEEPVAKVVSDAGMRQFHSAETEKYAHVTFFFNGGREEPFPGEDRKLVPSPKVATYDLQPEMSARGVTDAVVDAVNAGDYDFIIVNYANCDMVGHTGDFDAAVTAVETVDRCIRTVTDAVLAQDGVILITADHGNAEEMVVRDTGGPMTAHTTNPVHVILVAPEDSQLRHAELRQDGVLSAVGTTVIDLLGLTPPAAMDQASLIA
jgi:2,3-bisphosphoglycerate-independent phosphoglycerate mutase